MKILTLTLMMAPLLGALVFAVASPRNHPHLTGVPRATADRSTGALSIDLGATNEPPQIDLGVIEAGARGSKRISIRNTANLPICIDRAAVSCECLRLDGLPCEIPAQGSAELELAVDFSADPDYAGSLLMEAELRARDDLPIALVLIAVEVRNSLRSVR